MLSLRNVSHASWLSTGTCACRSTCSGSKQRCISDILHVRNPNTGWQGPQGDIAGRWSQGILALLGNKRGQVPGMAEWGHTTASGLVPGSGSRGSASKTPERPLRGPSDYLRYSDRPCTVLGRATVITIVDVGSPFGV